MADYSGQRERMVRRQIAGRGVRSQKVLEAMRKVPRERFLPQGQGVWAYDDGPLPIGDGQTISQPYIVAYMTEALALEGGETVLEIGTGSGYAAAVLAEIAADVYTIERIEGLATMASSVLKTSVTTTCTFGRVTELSAGRSMRRSTALSLRPAAPMFLTHCSTSSRSVGAWLYRSARPPGIRNWFE